MATGNTQQIINYGATANDGTGDPLRTAFIKTDENFDNVWLAGPAGSNVRITNNTISTLDTNGNLILRPNGTGVVQSNASIIPNSTNTRDLGTANLRWRSAAIGTGGLTVDGNVTVTGNLSAGNISYTGNVFVGDLQGSVYADDSTIMVDAVDNEMFASAATFGRANITGNVSANYFIGNGSQLTGIASIYGNANVADYLVSGFGTFGSNAIVTAGNIVASVIDVSGIQNQFPIGIQTDNGYVWQFAGNILRSPEGGSWQSAGGTEYFSSNANGFINLIAYNAGNLATELFMEHGFVRIRVDNGGPEQDWTFNVSGTLDVPGDIIPQSNGTASLGNSTNRWANLWVANNTIYIGGVPLGITGNTLTVNGEAVLSNNSQSNIATTGTITASQISTNGISSDDSTFVTIHDGLDVDGDIECAGNITANYFIGNGSQLTGLPEQYGNANVAAYLLTYTGNIAAGNITANSFIGDGSELTGITGNLSISGTMIEFAAGATEELITISPDGFSSAAVLQLPRNTYANVYDTILTNSSGNVQITSGDGGNIYDWRFDTTGNLVVPGNINFGGDACAAPSLNDWFSITSAGDFDVVTGTGGTPQTFEFGAGGNLTAPGNITANSFIGDGSQLTNIPGTIANANVLANVITFNTSAAVSVAPGQMAWNSSDGTVDIGIGYGNVVLQTGQETHYVVRNDTGTLIQDGTALYCSGVTPSGRISVDLMTSAIDPVQFLGLATMDINTGVNGVVTWFGYVRGLDTRGTANTAISVGDETWAQGDKLYVHPTAAGKLTKFEPAAPNAKICVASVIIRNQNSGVLFVRPTTNLRITDHSDVEITTPAANEFLTYAGNRWENTALDISVDTTPTLGGNLAAAGFDISNVGNITANRLQNDANLVMRSNAAGTAKNWTFDTLGDLNLPAGGNISGSGLITSARISVTGNINADTGYITGNNIDAATRVSGAFLLLNVVPLNNLPPANSAPGLRGFANDANLAAAGNFGAQVTDGGGNTVPVWSDGSVWRIG